MSNEIQVVESVGIEVFEAQERAELDRQIATAKAYPREPLSIIRRDCIDIVTMDKDTAESCRYAKPVAGKTMSGASVHLARVLMQQYGNVRVQQRIKHIDQKTITAEAVAWDMQKNYGVRVEARRSIIDRNGKRFADHVIETNAMAAMAIGERNAILKVIPKSLIDSVYKAAFSAANGDLSDDQKISIARKKALDLFAEKYNATEKDVLKVLGLRSVGQIGAEQIADLRGYLRSLTDGEISADELFGKAEKEAVPSIDPLNAKKKMEASKKEETKTAATTSAPADGKLL